MLDDHADSVRQLKTQLAEAEEAAGAEARRYGDKADRYRSRSKDLEQRLTEQEEINDHLEQIVEELREETSAAQGLAAKELEARNAAKDEAIQRAAREVSE